jgi:glutamyl-tRNA reductase
MPQDISFHLVGLSHHTASLVERERLALTAGECGEILAARREEDGSALLLSTCNRLEFYWAGSGGDRRWIEGLLQTRGANSPLTRLSGLAAVRHLFRVAAGLDSQILGETEILGQIRRAYEAAREAGTTTREMDLIFSGALAAGRRVRRETLLGRHPLSVASAAVEVGARALGGLPTREVAVLGAGEAAEGVLRALHEQGAKSTTLLNRHPSRAEALANAWGANVGSLEELFDALLTVDLLAVATASARAVVSAEQLARAMEARQQRELVVLDLAVPRNVEPEARTIPGLQLLDLDDLQRLCCPGADDAIARLAEAEQVVEDELVRLGLSLRGKLVAPQLAELHRLGIELAEQESAWALDQLQSLSEPQREIVRQMADRLVRRVLYPVSRNLRANI